MAVGIVSAQDDRLAQRGVGPFFYYNGRVADPDGLQAYFRDRLGVLPPYETIENTKSVIIAAVSSSPDLGLATLQIIDEALNVRDGAKYQKLFGREVVRPSDIDYQKFIENFQREYPDKKLPLEVTKANVPRYVAFPIASRNTMGSGYQSSESPATTSRGLINMIPPNK